ncbi:MAG TPA: AzlD domain-containing protein [Atribacteraceae bacterium]|nr:AzlD domain-containing protein [Atribacteraceae bacterium]
MIESRVFIIILGMVAVTCLTRALGFWLVGRFPLSRRLEAWFCYIPATVLISIVVPRITQGGFAEAIAAGVTVLLALRSRNLLLSMFGGILVVWIMRQFL